MEINSYLYNRTFTGSAKISVENPIFYWFFLLSLASQV